MKLTAFFVKKALAETNDARVLSALLELRDGLGKNVPQEERLERAVTLVRESMVESSQHQRIYAGQDGAEEADMEGARSLESHENESDSSDSDEAYGSDLGIPGGFLRLEEEG